MSEQPVFYIPHGGGPCFFIDDPQQVWTEMAGFLRSIPARLPKKPDAILCISSHWETTGFSFTGTQKPSLIFDYYGFPKHTYELEYHVSGCPELAKVAQNLLVHSALTSTIDQTRGFDHGVFIPMKVAFPDADIPICEMSLDRSLAPEIHLRAGQALSSLRNENVLIIGSGMSFHNMRGFGDPNFTQPSIDFDNWLSATINLPFEERSALLSQWVNAPNARTIHPREEHLLPLFIAAGAATAEGKKIYCEQVLKTTISAYQFN